MPPEKPGPWLQVTKDRWFLVLFAMVTLLVLRLVVAHAAVLMFAAVVTIVTYPVYLRLLGWTRRPAVAAVATTFLFGLVVLVPLAWLGAAFAQQAVALGRRGLAFVQGGGIDSAIASFQTAWAGFVPESLTGVAPDGPAMLSSGLQSGATNLLGTLTNSVPQIVASTATAGADTVIFIIAVATLYVQGPSLLWVIRDIAPLDEEYVDSLYAVFKDLAQRIVAGTTVTAITQGVVATIGYAIAGIDGLVFWGMLTSVFALVPVVGGAMIYLPLCALTFFKYGIGWALFLLAWQLVFTAQIDNVIRPFFLRGENNVHPLIILVAVLGGLAWLGVPGALVGPIVVVVFAALLVIFRRDFLRRKAGSKLADTPESFAELVDEAG